MFGLPVSSQPEASACPLEGGQVGKCFRGRCVTEANYRQLFRRSLAMPRAQREIEWPR